MRKQMDGLSALVQYGLEENPLSGSLFVFVNKARDKLKILTWENNGFIVWYKRLEKEKFAWPRLENKNMITISGNELNFLLDGYDIWALKPHQRLEIKGFT
jgi:transposase